MGQGWCVRKPPNVRQVHAPSPTACYAGFAQAGTNGRHGAWDVLKSWNADQSYCLLVTSYQISSETRKRLEIMTRTNDGFEIAEADLQLRGPGDLDGTQQSGKVKSG